MAKVEIEVIKATVDGKSHGEKLRVDQKDADKLVNLGYAKVLEEKAEKKSKAKAEA